ncbi:hypothetical protein DEO72_LG8g1879 [Vigna unguiculata]|uniref:Uncharacterized protein n=1 Tax=Vigna unguiculata TaxID=3917 RepID=A0A4D6MQN9_VIGUN|nr:hypothetical protein DEO72_LG8g1879 [Vigna unguiculata]
MRYDMLGDSYEIRGNLECGVPGVGDRPTRRYLHVRGIRGTRRLEAHVPRQAVWKRIAPGSSRAASGGNVDAERLFALDVHGLPSFGDTLKVGFLDVPLVMAQNVSLEL